MDQLVSYEVAKLAKEKEVDIKCSHYFILPFKSFKPDFVAHRWSTDLSDNFLQFVRMSKSQPHLAGAMTQIGLADWLRKEHDIHVFPSMYANAKDYEFKIYQKGKHLITAEVGLSFEDAFEKGLLEALKLVKSVKN